MVHLGPRKPPSRKGSMTDVPRDLLDQIAKLEEQFTVPQSKLKEVVNHFVSELTKGLSVEGGDIPMIPTWVMNWPTGKEKGAYLALDMGGTNLRVCEIVFSGNRSYDITQSKYHMAPELKSGKSEDLWDYIAECLEAFLQSYHESENLEDLCLGFTFSYPVSQPAINRGILQRWTKGFDIDGVEGKDVQPMLEKALQKRNLKINVTALINDTTGTMVASNYSDPEFIMGVIFGTGCNAAYFERAGNIPKLKSKIKLADDEWMAINTEWGAFDNAHKVLPRTEYDLKVDAESPRPGQQTFEKMIAGLYLGELLRLVLQDLYKQGFIFEGQDASLLDKQYLLDASFLTHIEEDPFENLSDVETLFLEHFKLTTTSPERKLIRRLAELIGTRSARLSACGVAAIAKKANISKGKVGADGSVFKYYPFFRERGAKALQEIFDWKEEDNIEKYPIRILPAEDGSGVGAALIAALTVERIKKGLPIGLPGA